ncbi:hypothetical protein AV530_018549 [Patagioenas fasciata monilis]|uniref:Uncharacterized protein n=1 Tax=Patagioenas fasciata monilis TaxID=372326 RepID=A0A1V4JSA2_PATFA|nr:hypothetical protein AV530_018549 [Patagioenas fasciata monilis]
MCARGTASSELLSSMEKTRAGQRDTRHSSYLGWSALGMCHPTDMAECQHHVLSFLPLLPGLKGKYSEGRKRQDANTYMRTFSEAGWVAKWEECLECPFWFTVKPDPSEHPQHN